MTLPDWITEARVALIISIASASFTFWQGWSAHVSARVAKSAQMRKLPTFEKTEVKESADLDDWRVITITARNHAEVSLQINAVRVTNQNGTIAHYQDAHEPIEDPRPINFIDRARNRAPQARRLRNPLPEHKGLNWAQRLEPSGSKSGSGRPRDVAKIWILAKNVDSHKDFAFDWIWLDGHER
ncbi:hypothetical protein [Paracoccus aminophilus]|uniref:Uncharacterized protein n=1 Tax=Paracoccus aminophilus JCM 7686 TaxID=1367847 RepID=S5Y0T1_PARAH|nr:hypothetical protein [Paracoccus aminophilus]AGT09330.1 hypothetical protein JCM7686_2260 [Paracoccus aminophilus JCM 7686]